jgi:hypothetical protein
VKTKVTPSGVTYRGTQVVGYNADGSITLRTGGWYTSTTKQRMNQYGRGVYVYQKAGDWFVVWEKITYPFIEGMTLYPNGDVIDNVGFRMIPHK